VLTDYSIALNLKITHTEQVKKTGVCLQELFQIGLPLAGVLIFHRHGQRLTGPDQESQFFGPRKACVNQVSKEPLKMLDECRDNHRPELAAL